MFNETEQQEDVAEQEDDGPLQLNMLDDMPVRFAEKNASNILDHTKAADSSGPEKSGKLDDVS